MPRPTNILRRLRHCAARWQVIKSIFCFFEQPLGVVQTRVAATQGVDRFANGLFVFAGNIALKVAVQID